MKMKFTLLHGWSRRDGMEGEDRYLLTEIHKERMEQELC